MQGTVLYGPRDVRFEQRETPKIVEPTDALIRMAATCVCGSDLWPYRGISPIADLGPMIGARARSATVRVTPRVVEAAR